MLEKCCIISFFWTTILYLDSALHLFRGFFVHNLRDEPYTKASLDPATPCFFRTCHTNQPVCQYFAKDSQTMGSIHEKITGFLCCIPSWAVQNISYFCVWQKKTHRHEGEIGHVFNLKIKPLFQACRQAGKFICKLKRICIFS